ncbi:MAG TPA: Qat anti-phage system TatD family nuclease QatD [Thermoanaerobaculia bacterium]|jgi:TatD DNase family protein|nr:Qat anti-phage system TatD family nuclease QatD [Thermoanaerobaculia bacterium]
MIDTHCHVDLYPRPTEVAEEARRAKVVIICVTNLPSAFERAYPHVKRFTNMRLALGLHPLLAKEHRSEHSRFELLLDRTSYIGEIGLDFSREGIATRDLQVESFRFVLRAMRGKRKFVTLHSRRAESAVLDMLEEEVQFPVVFHWFSGSRTTMIRALALGHFFSVNPAMLDSPNGQKIVAGLPPERVLTESDGPFVQVGGRVAIPSDVALVEEHLAVLWRMDKHQVRERIRENFLGLVRPLRQAVEEGRVHSAGAT